MVGLGKGRGGGRGACKLNCRLDVERNFHVERNFDASTWGFYIFQQRRTCMGGSDLPSQHNHCKL